MPSMFDFTKRPLERVKIKKRLPREKLKRSTLQDRLLPLIASIYTFEDVHPPQKTYTRKDLLTLRWAAWYKSLEGPKFSSSVLLKECVSAIDYILRKDLP